MPGRELYLAGSSFFADRSDFLRFSPLAITATSCQTNPAQSTCMPTLNPAFTGSTRYDKHWSGFRAKHSAKRRQCDSHSYRVIHHADFGEFGVYAGIHLLAMLLARQRMVSLNAGFFGMDISLRRSFPLHISEQTAQSTGRFV